MVGAITPGNENPLERFYKGMSGQENYSFRDVMGPNPNPLARGAAFVADVAADPLTYVSGGGSVLGKRLASEVVRNSLQRRGIEHVGRTGMKKWAEKRTGIAAARVALDAAPDATARKAAQSQLDRALDMDPNALLAIGAEEFGGAGAQAFQMGGSTGLRKFLKEELGDEAGEAAFSALPRDVQGGLRIRAPFWRDKATRGPASVGVGGGGRILEHLGLDNAAMKVHEWRTFARTRGIGKVLGDTFTGREGKAYTEMLLGLSANQAASPLRASYAGFIGAREMATKVQREVGKVFHRDTNDAMGPPQLLMQTAPDETAAREAMQKWFEDPEALQRLFKDAPRPNAADNALVEGAGLDSFAWHSPGVDALADPNERVGAMGAQYIHDFIRQQHAKVREMGVEIGDLNEYLDSGEMVMKYAPRVRSEAERAHQAATRPVKASKGKRGGGGLRHDPSKERAKHGGGYYKTKLVEMPDGTVQTKFDWMTGSEINKASGREVVVEDPIAVMAAYGDSMRQLATRHRYAQLMTERRFVAQGGSEFHKVLGGKAVSKLNKFLNLEGADHEGVLRQALVRAQAEAARANDAVIANADDRMAAKVATHGAADAEARLAAAVAETDEVALRQLRAQQNLADLTEEADQLVTDREGFNRRIHKLMQEADVDTQFEDLGTLVDGLVDYYGRHVTRRSVELGALNGADRSEMARGIAKVRKQIKNTQAAGKKAQTGKNTVDPGTQAFVDAGLKPLGEMRKEMGEVILPAALDQAYASPMVRQMAEMYYKAQGPASSELQGLLDSVYRPYFAWFKANATIMRGPGYHARNTIGGLWNNILYGVSGNDHQLSLALNMARRKAFDDAHEEIAAGPRLWQGLEVGAQEPAAPRGCRAGARSTKGRHEGQGSR